MRERAALTLCARRAAAAAFLKLVPLARAKIISAFFGLSDFRGRKNKTQKRGREKDIRVV